MKKIRFYLICLAVSSANALMAQNADTSFAEHIAQHRQHYKNEFISEPRSPLKVQDTALLDFYPPDQFWQVSAKVILSKDAQPFELPTYSGKTRLHRKYATLEFELGNQTFSLAIYQNLYLIGRDSSYEDYLFLPFKDLTNGEQTYGGGRYLDFRTGDIHDNTLVVDFNKCYNPYCAYSDGYNCPIPPKENHLGIEIRAGEKVFRGEKKH